jgi:hypothetical protein
LINRVPGHASTSSDIAASRTLRSIARTTMPEG